MANIAKFLPIVTDGDAPILPSALATSAPPPAPVDMSAGDAGAPPQMPAPSMVRAVYAPSPLQQNLDQNTARLQKLRFADMHPWGTADNHPGVAGKIAHALSVAGNLAGNIIAPGVMANIPGTQLNRQLEEMGRERLSNQEQNELSQNGLRDVNAQKDQAELTALPQQQADSHEENAARVKLANAQADRLSNPEGATPDMATYLALTRMGMSPSEALKEIEKDKALAARPVGLVQSQPVLGPDGKPHTYMIDPVTGEKKVDEGVHYERPVAVVTPGESRAQKNDLLKAYQPALDAAERMNVMTQNYEKAVKDHDQQAMLSLLANHLGMTMGLQKGARLTKDIIHEAEQSRPWLQGLKTKWSPDGYLQGVTLSPEQMRQMVELGQSMTAEQSQKARATGQYLGAKDDGPDRTPSASTIRYYMHLANGDAAKAKQLAVQDGWTVR